MEKDYEIVRNDCNGVHIEGEMPDGSVQSFDTVDEYHKERDRMKKEIKEGNIR